MSDLAAASRSDDLTKYETYEDFKQSDIYKDWYEALLIDNPDTFMHIIELSLFNYFCKVKNIQIPNIEKKKEEVPYELPSADVLTVDEWNIRYNYLKDMVTGSNITAETVSNKINIE